jgi:hypothetical protein
MQILEHAIQVMTCDVDFAGVVSSTLVLGQCQGVQVSLTSASWMAGATCATCMPSGSCCSARRSSAASPPP